MHVAYAILVDVKAFEHALNVTYLSLSYRFCPILVHIKHHCFCVPRPLRMAFRGVLIGFRCIISRGKAGIQRCQVSRSGSDALLRILLAALTRPAPPGQAHVLILVMIHVVCQEVVAGFDVSSRHIFDARALHKRTSAACPTGHAGFRWPVRWCVRRSLPFGTEHARNTK